MQPTRTFFGLALTLWGTAALAQSPLLYGVGFPGTTPLYRVDQSNGDLTAITPNVTDDIGDLTSDTRTADGKLWGVRIDSFELLDLNPATGSINSSVTITGSLDPAGSRQSIVSIAFNPVTGKLYGNTSVGFGGTVTDELFEIDPVTGAATAIGLIGFDQVYALGFSQTGTLYGVSDISNEFVSINTTTGSGSLIGVLTTGLNFDLASRPGDDVMFLADRGTDSLYTVDTANGVPTLVGDYGQSINIVGLAFTVPETSTWIAGATLALMATGSWLRRKQ